MQRLIISNWKMNLNPHQASLLVHQISQQLKIPAHVTAVICPPNITLVPLASEAHQAGLKLGAQNVYPTDSGAYTGEVSAAMLKGIVDYAIIGHSERRAMGETDTMIADKVAASLRNDLIPVICVGENLHEREAKLTIKTVTSQLAADLHQVTAADMENIVIAYEPIWAIGTGNSALPAQIQPVITAIRNLIEDQYGHTGSKNVRVLYGGSVTGENARSYLDIDGINGLLVGGASIQAESFVSIVSAA